MKSDLQLKQDDIEELTWEPAVDAARIGVQVKDGIVTLTGHLDSFAAKYAAEAAARRVPGVLALAVELDVRLPDEAQRNDADIARAAANVLAWTSVVPGNRIQVLVEDGAVSLTGTVDWNFQRQAAEHAVAGLYGVRGVSNGIVVRPCADAAGVREGILQAIARQASEDASHVQVDVHDGKVILSGSVRTWAERQAAIDAAWCAPGVVSVDNHIQVNL